VLGSYRYYRFTVTKDGWYRLRTTGNYASQLGSRPFIRPANGTAFNAIYGQLYNSPDGRDSYVVASLKAGTIYYAAFQDAALDMPLSIDQSFYVVQYDRNGNDSCSNWPETQVKEHGTDLALSGRVPSPGKALTFIGWATTPTATEPEYQPRDLYTIDAPVTLYAVWQNPDSLGAITGPTDVSYTPDREIAERCFLPFMVTEACVWDIASTNHPLLGNGYNYAFTGIYDANGTQLHQCTIIRNDEGRATDFSFTAAGLVPYKTYYIRIDISGSNGVPPVDFRFTAQYEPDPYGARSAIPDGTEVIEANAFRNTALRSLRIPASVTRIASGAFTNRSTMYKVIIENGDAVIEEGAFYGSGTEVQLVIVAPEGGAVYRYCATHNISFRRLDN